ncbi:hypothetical protein [Deinococcus planocerae]|uniref:hypothetical protein n=1 Tax=Deinococcus planocerae TaxID=1737569 RepID=UPI000C7F3AE1|nr:hypothetical protein [Deinococcus planocerae]
MKTHNLDTRMTSRAFREAVLDVYPDAAYKPERLRLLLLLLLCPWVDAEGRTVLDYSQLAACGNADSKGRNFKAADLLTDFEAHVMPLSLTGPEWRSKASLSRARTALPVWPQTVLDALRAELEAHSRDRLRDAVYFVSGRPYKPRQHREQLTMYRRQALEELLAHDHPALDLMRYANSQQGTVFARMVEKHGDAARAAALRLSKPGPDGQPDPVATQAAQWHALRILHGLESEAQPFYKPSRTGKTARVFADGLSYLGLSKPVRRALMPDCPELDLTNAQLAIAAQDWEVPEVQAFLSTGAKVWPELERHFQLEPDTYKPVLKSTLYALLFGMERGAIVRHLAHGGAGEHGRGIGEEKAGRLFDHPLIGALYRARERQLASLKEAGHARTVFGQTFPVTDGESARSALAAQAQAVELWLLLPAVELLRGNRDLTLVAWQHDGFTVHSSDKSKTERYVRQLQDAVRERAEQAGYCTRLERSE